MIDNQQYRLDFTKQKLPYVELLNFDNTKDVVQSLKEMAPHGPDVCIEAVGFHYATSLKDKIQMALMLETDPALMLNQMIMAAKKRGRLSIVSYRLIASYAPFHILLQLVYEAPIFIPDRWHCPCLA